MSEGDEHTLICAVPYGAAAGGHVLQLCEQFGYRISEEATGAARIK